MSDRAKFAAVLLFLAAAMTFLMTSVRREEPGLALQSTREAKPAPDWTLPNAATGAPVHLQAEAAQRPIVLSFWATWCGPCREELPHIERLAQKYQGRVGFYGIDSSDSPANIATFARQERLTFPMITDSHQVAASAYGADAIPLLAVVDARGKLRVTSIGYDPSVNLETSLSKILDALLSERAR